LDLFLMIKSRTPAIIEIMTITTNTIIRNTTKIFESESKNFLKITQTFIVIYEVIVDNYRYF
jgi:hypothetical protein